MARLTFLEAQRKSRSAAWIVAAATTGLLAFAGCASDSRAAGYTSEVENNYMKNCVAGTQSEVDTTNATAYCVCTYKAFVDDVSFDRFRDFEAYLRQHVGEDISSREDLEQDPTFGDIVDLLDECIDGNEP